MKRFLALVLTLTMLLSALPIAFARAEVADLSFTAFKSIFLFESDGAWQQDKQENDYFHYDLFFYIGDKLRVETTGGETLTYTAFYNESEDKMQFCNDADAHDVIEPEIIDTQEGQHWSMGENSYAVSFGGKQAVASVTVVENPVKSISYVPAKAQKYYFEADGHFEDDGNGGSFFHYDLQMTEPGDKLYVVDNDDVETVYTCFYDEQADELCFRSEAGERLNYGWLGVNCFEDQNRVPFTLGEDNYYHVVYSGRYCDVPVSIVESPVSAIAFEPQQARVSYFESEGRWETDEQGDPFFCYEMHVCEPGDVLIVTDKDNVETRYTAVWNERDWKMTFESADGAVIDEEEVRFYDEQFHEHFTLGNSNCFYVSYCGRVCTVPVELQMNPIASIRYVPANGARSLYFQNKGHWDTGDNGEGYFHYDFDWMEAGDMLYVTDSEDNETAFTARWDEDARGFVFESEDGVVIEENALEFFEEQHREPFTLGDANCYYVRYSQRTASVPVMVVESQIASMRFEPAQPKFVYFESDGWWETDENGQDFFRYRFGCVEENDRLILTDKDDNESIYTAHWEDEEHRFYFEGENGEVISEEDIECLDEQYQHHYLPDRENYFILRYQGVSCSVPISVLSNPVASIRYEFGKERFLIYETGGRWEADADNQPFYRYDIPFIQEGDRLYVTDAEDTETLYTAYWDDDSERMYFESDDGVLIWQESLEFRENQYDHPFSLGEDNAYSVFFSGREDVMKIAFVTAPIQALSFIPKQPIELYLNTDGQWETDQNGDPYFRYYGVIRISDGDILRLTDNDGNDTDYISHWNNQTQRREFISADNDIIYESELRYVDDQEQTHLMPGNENYFYVEYLGRRAAVPVSVLVNPVSAVKFIPVSAYEIFEESCGEWRQDGEGNDYYQYGAPDFRDGDVLRVTYSASGDTVDYTYSERDWEFLDADGNALDTEDKLYRSVRGNWNKEAEDNVFYVFYYEVQSNPIPVSIVENNVASIRYTQSAPRSCYFENGGRWETNGYGQSYYRYDYPTVETDDVLSVTYTDDSTKDFVAKWDDDAWSHYFEAEDGEILTFKEVHFYDRQYEEPYTPGDGNCYFVEYQGRECSAPLSVLESPLQSIAYFPREPISCFFEASGRWETNDNGDYFYYDCIFVSSGDVLEITYPDDSVKRFTGSWDYDSGEYFFVAEDGERIARDDVRMFDKQYDTPFSLGDGNCFYVTYLGKTCEVPVSVVESPVKAITFVPVSDYEIIEFSNGWWRDVNGQQVYHYDIPDFREGDKLLVTAPDDSVTEYTYHLNEYGWSGGFFDSDNNPLPEEDKLETDSDWDKEWSKGADDNFFRLRYYDVYSNDIAVQIVDNPIKEIRYTPVSPIVLFENANGHRDTELHRFIYALPGMRAGDVLAVTDRADNVTEYVLKQVGDEWFFEDADGKRIDEDEVRFDHNQDEVAWGLGSDNFFTVEYHYVTTSVALEIIENPVTGILFVPQQEIVIDEATGGRYAEGTFIYDPPVYTGDKFFVSYKTGETVEYVFDADAMKFTSADNRVIDAYDCDVYTNQMMGGWSPDSDNNRFTIAYAGFEQTILVTIRERFEKQVVAPTCTSYGYTHHTNPATGESYNSDYIWGLGHDFSVQTMNEHTLRSPASEGAPATYYYTCARCGAISNEEDLFFTANAGTIRGALKNDSLYRNLRVELVRDGNVVQETYVYTWDESGSFIFHNVEEGAYSIVISGDFVPTVTVDNLLVQAGEVLNLQKSDNGEVRAIDIAIGDMNDDDVVDIADLSLLLSEEVYGKEGGAYKQYDLNDDNVINIDDIRILLKDDNFGAHGRIIEY